MTFAYAHDNQMSAKSPSKHYDRENGWIHPLKIAETNPSQTETEYWTYDYFGYSCGCHHHSDACYHSYHVGYHDLDSTV